MADDGVELDPFTFGAEQRCFGCGPHNERGMRLRFRRVRPLELGVPIVARGALASREGHIATVNVRLEQRGKLGCSARVSYMLPDEEKADRYLGGALPEDWRHLFRED